MGAYVARDRTTNFDVWFDVEVPEGERLADAVLSVCEDDYARVLAFFRQVAPAEGPFRVKLDPGTFGAYHRGCAATDIHCASYDGAHVDRCRYLVATQVVEALAAHAARATPDAGWDCGTSTGEGLSRVLAAELFPAEADRFSTAAAWLDGGRGDFLNDVVDVDVDSVANGCAVLFLNFLHHQLGFPWPAITAAAPAGQRLADTYVQLTGAEDAFVAFSALLESHFPQGVASGLRTDNPFPLAEEPGSFTWDVLRPEDLLLLSFRFLNLVPEDRRPGAPLVRVNAGEPAFVVVDFPPQHIFEAATVEPEVGPIAVDVPARHRMAGPSRLAFRVPDAVQSVPFTLEGLLGWDAWEPSLVPVMDGREPDGEPPPIRPPEQNETSIELPYRLILNSARSGWSHSNEARDVGGRTELWHTALVPVATDEEPTLRAVWSPDWPDHALKGAEFGAQPMSAADRRELVGLTSDFANLTGRLGERIEPVAVPVERLMLTALGGWLRVHGVFGDPPPLGYSLVDWRHVASEGRDQYTKFVRAGTLYPFGLRAHLVTVTERKVVVGKSDLVAALVQRQFIIVTQPFRDYAAEPYPHKAREMPLRTVRVTTPVSANMPIPQPPVPALPHSVKVFRQDGTPFPFHIVATDIVGNTVDFTVGMFWIDNRDRDTLVGAQSTVAAAYGGDDAFCRSNLNGQRVTFAPPPTKPAGNLTTTGDTGLHALALRHQAAVVTAGDVLPGLGNAEVRIPALEQLAAAGAALGSTIELADAYLQHGLDDATQNASGLFAKIAGAPLSMALPAKVAGGLVNPHLDVTALSAHLGPVAGPIDDLASGAFDPKKFFGAAPKLLGAVGLGDLIDATAALGQMPQTVTRTEPPSGPPSKIVTTLDFSPDVVEAFDGFERDPDCVLSMRTVVEKRLDASPPTSTTDAKLEHFTFVLPPGAAAVIKIHFAALTFHSESGKKPDFSVELATDREPVEFAGVLSFLNELKKLIPSDGFSDPPAIEATEKGISTRYSLGLPPFAIGVFQLSDVRLGAALQLPFTAGKPRLRFNFCEREHPCLLTVSMLGGGAYLALGVGLDGIELIEAAIDFGGSFALELGVASGSVSALAGIYFRYDDPKKLTELDGFLRINGSVDVLGLVTVSVEFEMAFGYISTLEGAKIHGEARLTVKIHLTLFSTSVSLHVERSYGSAPGDPDFEALMPVPHDWDAYVGAFA